MSAARYSFCHLFTVALGDSVTSSFCVSGHSAESCTAKVNPEHAALGFAEHPYFERKRSHFIISHHQMLACGSC